MFSPNYPKTAIGIEYGSVTALSLGKQSRNSFAVKQAASVAIPANTLRPSFTEPNISDANEMLVSLNEAANEAGLKRQKRWSISLPSNTARAAILTLDTKPKSKQELNDVINWKSERSFGASANEMRVSLQQLPDDKEGKSRYFASAVKLSVLDEYETLFEALNWKVGLILPRHISESKWLLETDKQSDTLLISSQNEGFNAILMRYAQPTVIRSVTCNDGEKDDEIFRLLMFYRDRFSDNLLEKILVIGENFNVSRLKEIANEALGKTLHILRPEEVGLNIPASNLSFNELAAPAGLASLAWS
jgi:Tfp pilus assembly PilM family ATPase